MASLGDLVVSVGASIDGFTSAMGNVTTQLTNLSTLGGSLLESFDQNFGGIGEKAFELAGELGLTVGAVDVLKEALSSFSSAQDVLTSFTLLSGDAGEATEAFENLKDQATKLGVPFNDLVTAAQKLAPQFGVGTDAFNSVVQAAADAAAATGRSFQTISDGLDRIGISGGVQARQLAQMGISMQDVATSMGVSVTTATALLKRGGQDAQADVDDITQAIEDRFGGAATQIAGNLSGQFTNLKNELDFALEDIGKEISPIASDLLSMFTDVIPAVRTFADSVATVFNDQVLTSIQAGSDLFDSIKNAGGQIATAFTPVTELFSGLSTTFGSLGVSWSSFASSVVGSITHFSDLATILNLATTAVNKIAGSPASGSGESGNQGVETQNVLPTGRSVSDEPTNAPTNSYALLTEQLKEAQSAVSDLTKLQKENFDVAGQLATAQQRVVDIEAALHPQLQMLSADTIAYNTAMKDLGLTQKDGSDKVTQLETDMQAIQDAYDRGEISTQTLTDATDKFVKKMKDVQGAFQTTTGPIDMFSQDAAAKLDGVVGVQMQDQIAKMNAAIGNLGGAAQGSVAGFDSLDDILKSFGQTTISDATKHVSDLQAALASVQSAAAVGVPGAVQASIDILKLLDAAQIQVSQDRLDEKALGVPDLNTLALQLQTDTDAYNRLSQDGILSTQQSMVAYAKVLKDQIDYHASLGENVSDLKVKLDQVNTALQSQPTLWSTLQTAMKSVGDTIENGLGTAITGVEEGTKSLGAAFSTLGLNVVDIIQNSIIKLGVEKLFDLLQTGPGIIGSLGDALSGVSDKVKGLATNIGTAATNTATQATNLGDEGQALAGVADKVKGIGDAATNASSTAVSGFTNVFSLVTGAVSAIASIVGDIETAQTNSKLAVIEGEIRTLAIITAGAADGNTIAAGKQQQDNIFNFTKGTMMNTQYINDVLWNIRGVLYDDILPAIQAIGHASDVTDAGTGPTNVIGSVMSPDVLNALEGDIFPTLQNLLAVQVDAFELLKGGILAIPPAGGGDSTVTLDDGSVADILQGSIQPTLQSVYSALIDIRGLLSSATAPLPTYGVVDGLTLADRANEAGSAQGLADIDASTASITPALLSLQATTQSLFTDAISIFEQGLEIPMEAAKSIIGSIEDFQDSISPMLDSIKQSAMQIAAAPFVTTPAGPNAGGAAFSFAFYLDGAAITNSVITRLQSAGPMS